MLYFIHSYTHNYSPILLLQWLYSSLLKPQHTLSSNHVEVPASCLRAICELIVSSCEPFHKSTLSIWSRTSRNLKPLLLLATSSINFCSISVVIYNPSKNLFLSVTNHIPNAKKSLARIGMIVPFAHLKLVDATPNSNAAFA